MGSFSLSGGVEVYGYISPSNTSDEYPVIDPLYGIDGLRNVNGISDLDLIPNPRRRAGMVVGVSGGTTYYKLNPSPWSFTFSDWSVFSSGGGGGSFTGGTVSGPTEFTNGLTANTISASTYLNLPLDVFVTGFTYSDNTFTIYQNSGTSFESTINFMTGLTINGSLLTNQIYVENNQINVNYSQISATTGTSISSGLKVQDGNGLISGDTYFTIGQMDTFTGGNVSEYSGSTGYGNRGWVTQLNDIVIRNTNFNNSAPDGNRLIAENDILDGGSY